MKQSRDFDYGPTTPDGITSLRLRYKSDKDGNRTYYLCNGLIKEILSTYLPITEKEPKDEYLLPPYEVDQGSCDFYRINDPEYNEPYGTIKLVIYRLTTVIGDGKCPSDYRPELEKNQFIIGGSFALHKYLMMTGDPLSKKWVYNDIDFFFLGKISQNRLKVRRCLISHILYGNNTCDGWVIKHDGNPKMDFVRTDCDTLKEFIDCIDISVTGVFIVHHSMITADDYLVVIGEVEEMRTVSDDKYYLVATPKAIEDIKNNRQTYYRSHEDPSYARCLKRVAKYWERGFRDVVCEPKKIPHAIGGYMCF